MASLGRNDLFAMEQKGFAAPNSTREDSMDEGPTHLCHWRPTLCYMGTGHAQREIKQDRKLLGDLYILMGRSRTEKKSAARVSGSVEHWKTGARILQNVIYLLRIAAAGSRSGIGVTHTALGAVDICGRKSFLPLQGAE